MTQNGQNVTDETDFNLTVNTTGYKINSASELTKMKESNDA